MAELSARGSLGAALRHSLGRLDGRARPIVTTAQSDLKTVVEATTYCTQCIIGLWPVTGSASCKDLYK